MVARQKDASTEIAAKTHRWQSTQEEGPEIPVAEVPESMPNPPTPETSWSSSPGDLGGHLVSLFSELVEWVSVPSNQMILAKPVVNPNNIHYKTGLCHSAFTSEYHIKEKLLHICGVEGVGLEDHERIERW